MPSRTPFTAVALAKYNATDHAKMPKGWLGYEDATANTGSVNAETDLAGLSVAVDLPASRMIRIVGYVPRISSDTAGDMAVLRIKEGATQLQEARIDVGQKVGGANGGAIGKAEVIIDGPSAGSHTYKLTGALAAGTGDLSFRASSSAPSFILVEDLGPASS